VVLSASLPGAAPRPERPARAWLAAAVLVAAVFAAAMWTDARRERELAALPSTEREALVARVVETLRTTCVAARGPELTQFCRDQARLVARMPECGGECRELAARHLPRPSR